MINQVLSTNIVPKGTYSDFKQPENGWYLPANSEEEKRKRTHKWGMTIAISALTAGFGTLALLSGPKRIVNLLNKWKVKLEQKAAKGGTLKNFYRYAVAKITLYMEKSESINNFTTLKDVLFQRLMCGKNGQRGFTRRIHEGITKIFDKLSRKTVNSAYANTQKEFASLNEYLTMINEELLAKHPKDARIENILGSINLKIKNVNELFENGFGLNARNGRLLKMKNAYDGLFDFFWNASVSDIKNFKSKNMYNSYIAEDYLLPAKMNISSDVGKLRKLLSHNLIDNYKSTIKAISDIQKFVNPKDTNTNEILETLRVILNNYKKEGNTGLNKEIVSKLHELQKSIVSFEYEPQAIENMTKYIKEVESIISQDSKGQLQELLSIYKEILPNNEYLKLCKKVNSAVKSLDNAIEIETGKYFDKARDLKLGSAPTDILSILFGVGTVGYYVSKSDNKDERISAVLRYGMPAIGTIASSLYLTAKLVSGGKAIALSLISGAIINRLGEYIDKVRKKYSLDISLEKKTLVKSQSDNV